MALMTFEQLDRSIDADSDSDDELAEQAHMYKGKTTHDSLSTRPQLTYEVMTEKAKGNEANQQLAGLSIGEGMKSASPPAKPPRRLTPPQPPVLEKAESEDDEIEEDENDPFADRNAVPTPMVEKDEPRWKII